MMRRGEGYIEPSGLAATLGAPNVNRAIARAQENLLRLQEPGGHWLGELMVDATLCADYVLFMHWSQAVDPERQQKCVDHILSRQLPEGGWNIYHEGSSEINATVKAYFALKLAGHPVNAPHMREARSTILRLGGIPAMNSYAKLYLALMGQFPWKYVPTIPVEMILFPDWSYFNIYKISSWSRAMLMPLAIISHYKPTRHLPDHLQLHELYPYGTEGKNFSLPLDERFFTWRNFFLRIDRILKRLHRFRIGPLRELALRHAGAWMRARMGEGSDGLAAVFPAMLNSIIALRALGVPDSDPLYCKAVRDFEGLFLDDEERGFRIQPCLSPVWDTAINTLALADSGLSPDHPALQSAIDWLESKEVRIRGDWSKRNPHPEASGWAFEFNNVHYPDTDDTMMVLMAMRFFLHRNDRRLDEVFARALPWLISFQCKDGGWGAFDKDVMMHWLEDVPFADHRAILDPTCSDLTARMLELLGYLKFNRDDPRIQRAIKYMRTTQEADGSWYGRWGVNYIYGTWQALRGLAAIGEPMDQPWIVRARNWLESCQNDDGGWGESPVTYEDPSQKGRGPTTPSQTAWAVMGLAACGDPDNPALRRGIRYLVETQNDDGSWSEEHTTGTGFPKVFYLKYDMYRNNFPLLALSTCSRGRETAVASE